MRNGKSTAGHQRYLCSHCRKHGRPACTASQPGTHQKIIDSGLMRPSCRSATARPLWALASTRFSEHLSKNSGRSGSEAASRAVTSLFARKWTNSGVTSSVPPALVVLRV
ncbi:IS1 family transposase [Escherichia coli]|uniref:IS1 family transposase n=1 Tax=Escherichia coli TaxID=562 RepID=UPI0035CB0CB4